MVQALLGQLSPQAQAYVNKTTMPIPKYTCASCTKLKDGYFCDCFIRPVDKDNNKCFNHSNYVARVVVFKAPENLDTMVEEQEKKRYA